MVRSEKLNAECKMQNEPPLTAGGVTEGDGGVCKMQNAELNDDSESSFATDSHPSKSNKAHLTSSVPRAAKVPNGALTKGQISEIRNILGDLDDAEIQRLYKRVTK